MTITIITVGNQPKPELNNLVQSFEKRLPRHIKVNWRYLKHGVGNTKSSIKHEAERILNSIPKKNTIILLDESGIQLSSNQLSNLLFSRPVDITFIIGGAYGVTDDVKNAADTIWSLGKLVFPHQIVRLILSEQLYRANCIKTGHPYHHV